MMLLLLFLFCVLRLFLVNVALMVVTVFCPPIADRPNISDHSFWSKRDVGFWRRCGTPMRICWVHPTFEEFLIFMVKFKRTKDDLR